MVAGTDTLVPVNDLDHIILGAKLKQHAEWASSAVEMIIAWLQTHPEELITLARGRHVYGHYRYGDRNFAEYDQDRLIAEAAEEIADCINYLALYLHRENKHNV